MASFDWPGAATAQSPWEAYITRAKLYNSYTRPDLFYDSFNSFAAWGGALTSTGNITRDTTLGSVILLTSGATASSQALMRPGNGPTITAQFPCQFVTGSTAKMYVRWRSQVTTAINANATAVFESGAAGMKMGVVGSASTANFVAVFTGGSAGTITSTVAIDTAMHTFELWLLGDGTARFAVDAEAVQSTASYPASAGVDNLQFLIANGATATTRTMLVDEYFSYIENPN